MLNELFTVNDLLAAHDRLQDFKTMDEPVVEEPLNWNLQFQADRSEVESESSRYFFLH